MRTTSLCPRVPSPESKKRQYPSWISSLSVPSFERDIGHFLCEIRFPCRSLTAEACKIYKTSKRGASGTKPWGHSIQDSNLDQSLFCHQQIDGQSTRGSKPCCVGNLGPRTRKTTRILSIVVRGSRTPSNDDQLRRAARSARDGEGGDVETERRSYHGKGLHVSEPTCRPCLFYVIRRGMEP